MQGNLYKKEIGSFCIAQWKTNGIWDKAVGIRYHFCYDDREVRGMKQERQIHPIAPLYNEQSLALILGSFPSVKSRETMFFYGHPQNRFWPVLAELFGEATPKSVEEKKKLAQRHGIALWDVIAQCEIRGSSDSSIANAVPNDITKILRATDIRAVFCNGTTAYTYYNKYCRTNTGREAILLPSTSPANARWTKEKLVKEWGERILPYLSDAR